MSIMEFELRKKQIQKCVQDEDYGTYFYELLDQNEREIIDLREEINSLTIQIMCNPWFVELYRYREKLKHDLEQILLFDTVFYNELTS